MNRARALFLVRSCLFTITDNNTLTLADRIGGIGQMMVDIPRAIQRFFTILTISILLHGVSSIVYLLYNSNRYTTSVINGSYKQEMRHNIL